MNVLSRICMHVYKYMQKHEIYQLAVSDSTIEENAKNTDNTCTFLGKA